ncbi:MAG: RNA polymerase sigma factor RpoH [Steroidobacteraceae bacterium]
MARVGREVLLMTTALVAKQAGGLVFAGPVGSLDSYIDRVSQIPVLSKEDEVALATRFRTEADLDAARQLVLSHLRFVVHIARGYLGYGLPMGDLVQEGNVGLMKAVKRFDPAVGVRLVSFAVHWIRAEIHEYVLRNWRLVKVATTKSQRKLFFNLRKMKKNLAWLSEAETAAVARELGVEVADVREMEQRLSARDMSFDPMPESDEEESYSPAMYLPASNADPATEVENEEWEEDSTARLTMALEKLDERSRSILKRRWMTDNKATLHELADEYGISAERVRQVESNAINKLKGLMAAA